MLAIFGTYFSNKCSCDAQYVHIVDISVHRQTADEISIPTNIDINLHGKNVEDEEKRSFNERWQRLLLRRSIKIVWIYRVSMT
jgi:hypothetical protein